MSTSKARGDFGWGSEQFDGTTTHRRMTATRAPRLRWGGRIAFCVAIGVVPTIPEGGALADPTVPCNWCCQQRCGGGGGSTPVGVAFYAFNGSAYATVNGTNIYNGQVKTISLSLGAPLVCHVNATSSTVGYHFAGWYSSKLSLAASSSCSTTFSSLLGGGGEMLTLLMNRTSLGGWGGYSINATHSFNEVSGIFTVPTTQYLGGYYGSPTEVVSEWVGFGGADYWWSRSTPSPGFTGHDTIWQAGVSEWYRGSGGTCGSGSTFIFMWFEAAPDQPVFVVPNTSNGFYPFIPCSYTNGYTQQCPWEPNAGDSIQVTITLWYNWHVATDQGNVTFLDLTTGNSWSYVGWSLQFYSGNRIYPQVFNLDWVVEAPGGTGLPVPMLTTNVGFSGGWFEPAGTYVPIGLNMTNQLLQRTGNNSGVYPYQWVCPGGMNPGNGDFSVRYSSPRC